MKLIEDGVRHVYDTALLISGDSDLCPAVRSLNRLCPAKRVVAVFPPRRHSAELTNVTNRVLRISDANIRQSQLPVEVVSESGVSLKHPIYWT